jgi:hypothetical protein
MRRREPLEAGTEYELPRKSHCRVRVGNAIVKLSTNPSTVSIWRVCSDGYNYSPIKLSLDGLFGHSECCYEDEMGGSTDG